MPGLDVPCYSKKGSVIPQTDGNLKDYTLAMPGAANIALYDIARVLPDIRKYTAVQAESGTAYEYDLRELTRRDGQIAFMRFADDLVGGVPCTILPDGHTLWVDSTLKGNSTYITMPHLRNLQQIRPDDYEAGAAAGSGELDSGCV